MTTTDAEQVALVKSLIAQARRLGLVWTMRNATVVDGTDVNRTVIRFDGDTGSSFDIISVIGRVITGQRVVVASVPPAGQFIIGKLNAPGYMIETGTVGITPVANTPTSASVVYTQPFPTSPHVTVSAHTSVPGSTVLEVSINNPSATGFDAVIYRTTATVTSVHWHAILTLA